MAALTFVKYVGKGVRDYTVAIFDRASGGDVNAVMVNDAAMGEVAASPTANTVLGRLKDLATALLTTGIKVNGHAWTSSLGITGAAFTSADQSAAAVAITDAPTSGQKLVIDSLLVSAGATAQLLTISEETSGTIIARIPVAINSGFEWKPGFKLATADKKLMLRSSASGNVYATAVYHSEA